MADMQQSPTVTGKADYAVIDSGLSPSNIIHLGDKWAIKPSWELDGVGVNMLSGQWRLQFYVEFIGDVAPSPDDQEFLVFEELVNFADTISATPATLKYEKTFWSNVKFKKQVTVAGVYKPVLVFTCLDPKGVPGPFAGFVEGQLIQFYP